MMEDPTTLICRLLLSDEAHRLREVMEPISLDDGEVLFRRGDPGDALYLIDAGRVRIFTLDEQNNEITLNTLGPGETFGELALLDERPRSAGAAAIGSTRLRRLRREDFLAYLHTSPALNEATFRLLSQRARYMTDYIERLGLWARQVAEGKYDQAMQAIESQDSSGDSALAAVADAVRSMVRAVKEREEQLRRELAQLRIEIDDAKRKRQVEEITETDYFQHLAREARQLRQRGR
jgi:CRP-like cAMP-binding protein